MSTKRILGVLPLILLAASVMPGLPATLASAGITAGAPLAAASNTSDARGAGVRAAADEDPLVADTRKRIDTFVQLWKENKLEELVAGYFTEDPLMLPPNHEPIRGRQAILAYFKSLRDAVGEFDKGDYLIRATPSGDNSVSWAGQFSFHDGKLRFTAHELFVREPDGSMRCAVKMVGFRDPMA
jgi:ketosteroid isomerase-like protein